MTQLTGDPHSEDQAPDPVDDLQSAQSLTSHLRDLRSCLIVSLVAIVVGFAATYSVIDQIGIWFFKPLTAVLPQGSSLIFTSYQEGFFFT